MSRERKVVVIILVLLVVYCGTLLGTNEKVRVDILLLLWKYAMNMPFCITAG